MRKREKKKCGRPKKEINWKKVDEYLRAQCDGVGIASLLGMNPETLYKACKEYNKMGFSEYSALKRSEGKELLRFKQFQTALDGDKTMMVWLGKQYLDQKERSDANINISDQEKKNRDDFLNKINEIGG